MKAVGKDIETKNLRKSRHTQLPALANASARHDESRTIIPENSDSESCKMTRNASQDSDNFIKINNQTDAVSRR